MASKVKKVKFAFAMYKWNFLKVKQYTHVHSSIIHNHQNAEAMRVFINGWMDK